MLVSRFLVFSAPILVAFSVLIAGRFNFPAVREGNALDRFFIKVQLGLNVVSIPLAAILPVLTSFKGQPWLAYIAVVLVTTALLVYPVQLPARRPVAPSTKALRSVAAPELRRTRWPYRTLFALGYSALLIYAFPLAASHAG